MSMELDYIVKKFELDPAARTPIEFRLSRHGGLTSLFHELGYKEGVEVGVEEGKYSEEICRDNPGVHLYCVDPWIAYSRYIDEVSQDKLDRYFATAKERLKNYNCTFIRKTSMEAVKDFAPNSLDFAYIDGNHDFEWVVNDIIYWSKIVRPGGIVAGHDYKNEAKNRRIPFHVVQAINSYTDSYAVRPWFVLRGDKCASWMYVKPESA
jgi:hypothetical protein